MREINLTFITWMTSNSYMRDHLSKCQLYFGFIKEKRKVKQNIYSVSLDFRNHPKKTLSLQQNNITIFYHKKAKCIEENLSRM